MASHEALLDNHGYRFHLLKVLALGNVWIVNVHGRGRVMAALGKLEGPLYVSVFVWNARVTRLLFFSTRPAVSVPAKAWRTEPNTVAIQTQMCALCIAVSPFCNLSCNERHK